MRERLTDKHKRRWLFKQLLPLHYCTVVQPVLERTEKEMRLGPWEYVRWRMFMGRCFNVRRTVLD